jgi:hypothetical protein
LSIEVVVWRATVRIPMIAGGDSDRSRAAFRLIAGTNPIEGGQLLPSAV